VPDTPGFGMEKSGVMDTHPESATLAPGIVLKNVEPSNSNQSLWGNTPHPHPAIGLFVNVWWAGHEYSLAVKLGLRNSEKSSWVKFLVISPVSPVLRIRITLMRIRIWILPLTKSSHWSMLRHIGKNETE
jgi:hypothetical protein